jgi:hypothetical protein
LSRREHASDAAGNARLLTVLPAPYSLNVIVLFSTITVLNLLCLVAAAVLGYAGLHSAGASQWHQLFGIFTAIVCCGVHCIVMTYFMATGKWIGHAISVKNLDSSLAAPARSFKAQAYPAALVALLSVFVTAVAGAATASYQIQPALHHWLALSTWAINAVAAVFEYRAIRRNGLLIDRLLARINEPNQKIGASAKG